MTDKEKAKAYDKLFAKAKRIYNKENDVLIRYTIEDLFPELAESEDEKVRKELIKHLKEGAEGYEPTGDSSDYKRWLAWLEKQGESSICNIPSKEIILAIWDLGNEWKELTGGSISTEYDTQLNYIQNHWHESEYYLRAMQNEQNHIDKVEPKFRVGDWIINPRTGLIKHIKNVLLCDNNGNYEFESSSMSIDSVDNSFHLWTIQDAKDGDVLFDGSNILLVKEVNHWHNVTSYLAYSQVYSIREYFISGSDVIIPATKEQRDLLFQKMKEAGYEWDAEKKELKKIEQTPEENKGNICGISPNWSEDDETKRSALISLVKEIKNQPLKRPEDWDGYINWLQLLKDRVQSKQEWSEEEIEKAAQEWDSKANFNPFYMTMEGDKPTGVKQHITTHKESFKAGVNWVLNSLKGRVHSQWKPTDKQMNVLWYHCSDGSILKSLYNDLKKLKEE